MMWESTMNPETRRLICVTMETYEQYSQIFDTLLGDDLESRKQIITDKFDIYMEEI